MEKQKKKETKKRGLSIPSAVVDCHRIIRLGGSLLLFFSGAGDVFFRRVTREWKNIFFAKCTTFMLAVVCVHVLTSTAAGFVCCGRMYNARNK